MKETDYYQLPEVTPIDRLDAGCQAHDKDCANGGCSKKGDLALADVATAVALTTSDPLLRTKALAIAGAMIATSTTRSR
jgi:hypothetical protein